MISTHHHNQRKICAVLLYCFSILLSPQAAGTTVALFHALKEDLSALVKAGATKVRSFNVGTTAIQHCVLGGHAVYVVRMGSGCVQTSLAVQALLAKQKCDLVISVGPVGDINGNLEKGKWHSVNEVFAWQMGSHDSTGFRSNPEARMAKFETPYDQALGKILTDMPKLSVASGEVFVASDDFRSELATSSGCAAVDMNLFGLLQVLKSHNVGGIHLRVPSDLADAGAGDDFRAFSEAYDGAGGRLAAELILALPKDETSPETHEALRNLLNPQSSSAAGTPSRIQQSGKEKDGASNPADAVPLPAD